MKGGEIMKVKAKLYPSKDSQKSLAFGQITLDDVFVVTGISVKEGKSGLFVSMPQYKAADGSYHDKCFPTTPELRKQINETVLEEYKNIAQEQDNEIITELENEF